MEREKAIINTIKISARYRNKQKKQKEKEKTYELCWK